MAEYDKKYASYRRAQVVECRVAGSLVNSEPAVVGWAEGYLITLNDGNPAGYKPILVLDAWEHAFVPDYKPTERAKYVEAYLQNIDWKAAEGRAL